MSNMFYALNKIQNGATTKTNPNARDMCGFGRYEGDELKPFEGRPGAMDAFALPSRRDNYLSWPDGRFTDLRGNEIEEPGWRAALEFQTH